MKFIIDLNRGWDDGLLKQIGAKEEHFEDYSHFTIDIDSFEDIESLLRKVDSITKDHYSAVISFDPATIYLDEKI